MSVEAVELGGSLGAGFDLRFGDLSPAAQAGTRHTMQAIGETLHNLHVSSLEEARTLVETEADGDSMRRLTRLTARLTHIIEHDAVPVPDWAGFKERGELTAPAPVDSMACLATGELFTLSDYRNGDLAGAYVFDPLRAGWTTQYENDTVVRNEIVGVLPDDTVIIRNHYYRNPLLIWDPRRTAEVREFVFPLQARHDVVYDSYRNRMLVFEPGSHLYTFDPAVEVCSTHEKWGYVNCSLTGVTAKGFYVFEHESALLFVDPKTQKEVAQSPKNASYMSYLTSLPNGDVLCQQRSLPSRSETRWTTVWKWTSETGVWSEVLACPPGREQAHAEAFPDSPGMVSLVHTTTDDMRILYMFDALSRESFLIEGWNIIDPASGARVAASADGRVYVSDGDRIKIFGEPL